MKNAEKNSTTASAVAEQGAHAASEKAAPKKAATKKKGATKGKSAAKAAKAKPIAPAKKNATAKKASQSAQTEKVSKPRAESKGAKIIEMISQPDGATLAEIMKATDWQKHSVRGFITTAGKKHTIESTKNEAGERVYKIAK